MGLDGNSVLTGGDSLLYDPSSYALHEDPFPVYRRLQEGAPLYHNADIGFWALTRFDDVLAGLSDPGRFSSAQGTLIEQIQSAQPAPAMMIFTDPPRHDELRKLVSRAFTPRRVAELERDVRAMCEAWLDPMADGGGGEIVADLAGKLPLAPAARRHALHVARAARRGVRAAQAALRPEGLALEDGAVLRAGLERLRLLEEHPREREGASLHGHELRLGAGPHLFETLRRERQVGAFALDVGVRHRADDASRGSRAVRRNFAVASAEKRPRGDAFRRV